MIKTVIGFIGGTPIIIVLVLFILAFQIRRRQLTWIYFRRWLIGLVVILCGSFVAEQLLTFRAYQHDKLGQYFLPPHSTAFLQQVDVSLNTLLSNFLPAAIITGMGLWAGRRQKFQQIGLDDLMLITLGAVAVGWPAVLIFLAIVFSISVLGLLGQIIVRRKTINDRLIITPYIIPAVIITLIFRTPLLEITHLIKIRF